MFWGVARAFWQRICNCVGARSPGLCSTCGGAWGGNMVNAEAQGLCRWCRGHCGVACASCGQGVHFRGQCNMWNMGACWSFSPHAAEDNVFCPDCAWKFIRATAPTNVNTVDASASNVALEAHLAEVAAQCKKGAGHEAPAVRVPWSVRAARRWVLRYLKRRNWTRMRHVLDAAGVHANIHDLSFAPVACRRALDGLKHDGKVYTRSVGQVAYVHRACRLGPSPFVVHKHSRRRRRRRSPVAGAEVATRRVSRRISSV